MHGDGNIEGERNGLALGVRMSSRKSIALRYLRYKPTQAVCFAADCHPRDIEHVGQGAYLAIRPHLCRFRVPVCVNGGGGDRVCHSFVTDGCVQFLGDLAEVAGQARAKGVTCEQAHMLLDEN